MDKATVIAIDTPHFYAAVVIKNGLVIKTAPILKYMYGWSQDKIFNYTQAKGWKTIIIEQ